ncbi:SDR family NAD(P)-dependent oxidoreductase [Dactylosporangium sp. CA-092794]|uniref:SDR family NAD(P)-dependent oxidoreductase n=1 Tax=Dactylosporangium sp. CA-092794 TaxID=3239929 RepID=UPI003D901509
MADQVALDLVGRLDEVVEPARRLRGKVAVITGSGHGIGAATSALFAAHGATVIGLDIDADAGAALAEALGKRFGPGAAVFHAVDVGDVAEVGRVAAAVLDEHPRIDVLFNNAGILGDFDTPLAETDFSRWRRIVDVNLTGVIACSQAFLPGLRRSAAGSVIHNATIDALLGNPHAALYSASKGGIIPLTHVMAYEFGVWGIRVNCIVAGGIPTGLGRGQVSSEYEDALAAATSLRRRGRPIEAATVALFLATGDSSFVNGTSLQVDGGRIGLTPGTL